MRAQHRLIRRYHALASGETVLRILDEKLRPILDAAGVFGSELVDEVIESGAQVVDGLPEDNPEARRDGGAVDADRRNEAVLWAQACERRRPVVDRHRVHLIQPVGVLDGYELRQVFMCPVHTVDAPSSGRMEYPQGMSNEKKQCTPKGEEIPSRSAARS
ncbi:MAG: hypothetical protein GEU90_15495 [Gemmatimonas sp.]|nr:hypothetical protein [Gemmatimonas sp.]